MTSSWKKIICVCKIKFPTKRIFRIFPMLRIDGMAPFCNLFMERPSYNKGQSGYTVLRQEIHRNWWPHITSTSKVSSFNKVTDICQNEPVLFFMDMIFLVTTIVASDFYHAAWNADVVLRWDFCLSVCPSVKRVHLWQNGRKICLDFYIIRKNIYPSFLRRRMVGGGWPLLPEILGQPARVGAKSPILNR